MLTAYWVSDLMTEQDTGCFGTEMPCRKKLRFDFNFRAVF